MQGGQNDRPKDRSDLLGLCASIDGTEQISCFSMNRCNLVDFIYRDGTYNIKNQLFREWYGPDT